MPVVRDPSTFVVPPGSAGSADLDVGAVVDRLLAGGTVVVPTAAAAEGLRRAVDARALSEGLEVWEVRSPVTWESWTGGFWNALLLDGAETRTLLNGLQERALWAEAIAQHEARAARAAARAAGTTGGLQDLATLATSAFALMEAYRLPTPLRAYTEDTRAFAAWLELFRARCDWLSVLPAASVEAELAAHLRRSDLPKFASLPDAVDLIGFVELTPARRYLLEALRTAGTEVREGQLRFGGERNATIREMPTPDAELRSTAESVRDFAVSRLRAGETVRIAVMGPDPEAERAEIDGTFRELLTPDLPMPAWSFTAGPELVAQPPAREALDLLRGLLDPLPPDRVTALLLSPGLGEPGFRQVRARLDAQVLRRRPSLHPELTLAQVERRLSRQHQVPAPQEAGAWLSRVLRVFDDRLADPEHPRSMSENGDLVHALLEAAGWQPPDTVAEAWGRALDQLATLDLLGRRLPFRAFLSELERVCRGVRLQEPRPHGEVELRVLPLAELEGAAFDAVFALRSTDNGLGATPRAHPLLSWEMQRTHGLPGAHTERDAERLRRRLGALMDGAGEVRFTSAAADADGPLRPSPLPEELRAVRLDDAACTTAAASVELIAVADDLALPRLAEDTVQKAGAQLLKDQAACPFRAFAHFRLGAEPLERPVLGLQARHTGDLVHWAMEAFWAEHGTRERLAAMSASERDGAIETAVDSAFTRLIEQRHGLLEADATAREWNEAYLDLQRERLVTLTSLWLEQELRRGDFTVQPPEDADRIMAGPLLLDIRPDRVDLTADGGAVFIDYKTGNTAGPKAWEGDRPDEPQIPLYALRAEADPGTLRAVALARFRVGEGKMRWEGLQVEEGVLPGKNEVIDLADRLAEWRRTLDRLAWGFAEGQPTVDPKEYPKTCQYCSQRMLCRFDPAEAAEDEIEEGDGDA